jgi:hypothetical protein
VKSTRCKTGILTKTQVGNFASLPWHQTFLVTAP